MREIVPIGMLADVTLGKMLQPSPKVESDELRPYLRAAHVQPFGRIDFDVPEKLMWFSKKDSETLSLRAGDAVIVEGGAGFGRAAHLSQDLEGWGFQNSIVRLRSHSADTRFLVYALSAALDSGEIGVACNAATFAHFTAEKVEAFRVPHHDRATQQRIADYLDRETGEIGAMIAKMDQLAAQLEARRDVVWGTEFKEALRVGAGVKLSLLIESIVDGPFGSSLTSAHYSDEGARVVRLGNVGINTFRNDDMAFVPLAYAEKLGAHTVLPGDVVIAGLGDERMPLGRAAVLPDIGPAIVKADCYRVRPNPLVSARYLAWALSAPQARSQFKVLSRGTTRARLNTKVVQQVEVPLITPDQQSRLLDRQASLTIKIGQMLAKVAELKSLLTERRAALITDVVTGRKEVA